MKFKLTWTALVAVCILWSSTPVLANSAEKAFADGEALLAKADFQGAMQSFAKAARADRSNRDYLQHYSMVQQIITLRKNLDVERDPQRWEYIARALHAFYLRESLHGEALTLDEKIHARLNTATSATMLAETQLALGMNAEAAQTLAGLPADKQTVATKALQGLALAREGKLDDARQISGSVSPADDASPGELYSVARLNASLGNEKAAATLLTRCFESLAPSRLDALKDHARTSPDFSAMAGTELFAQALKTESKVAESKCSGGSRCAGCPMRGSCPSSQGQ